MNGYHLCFTSLAVLVLITLGRFLAARRQAGSPPMDVRSQGYLQSVYFMLWLCAPLFLCKDALIWSWYAFAIPLGPWPVVFGMLSGLNLAALLLPVLFKRTLEKRYGRDAVPLANLALLSLWFSNVFVGYVLWGAFCGFCYFG